MYTSQHQAAARTLRMVNINTASASVSSANSNSAARSAINLNLDLNLNSPLDLNNNSDPNNDQYSLSSSISQSSYNSRTDNSLIFERLVQDPLTDIHPPSLPRNRNITTETFIPASLDATTELIKDNEFVIEEPVQFGFSSRRSSLANLEAALGGPSRRASLMNTPRSLSRSNTNTSFSNLTQQLQNASKQPQHTYQQPQSHIISRSSSQLSNLPPLTTTISSNSNTQRNSNTSPVMNDKCFCSYADIIAQEDHESKFAIRRPSLSASFSGLKLERGNSTNSTLNSPRSPPISHPQARTNSTTRFRQNSGFNTSFNSSSFSNSKDNNNNTNNTNKSIINSSSPMNNNNNNNSINTLNDDESELFINTPRKGFSGRSIPKYSNKLNSTQNIDELLKQKLNLSPQISKQES
ncbi:hypothetical protein CANINC_002194 [Pichia inconspicua]|uniref:Uncharacterized protein n=1 Tax=Pichia inconspicua TaxID=52247 RepID=A0A4T0X3B8_9ASCO|nr:hypothetical protein CANINC_002194 [[Candida] inconspicua]